MQLCLTKCDINCTLLVSNQLFAILSVLIKNSCEMILIYDWSFLLEIFIPVKRDGNHKLSEAVHQAFSVAENIRLQLVSDIF